MIFKDHVRTVGDVVDLAVHYPELRGWLLAQLENTVLPELKADGAKSTNKYSDLFKAYHFLIDQLHAKGPLKSESMVGVELLSLFPKVIIDTISISLARLEVPPHVFDVDIPTSFEKLFTDKDGLVSLEQIKQMCIREAATVPLLSHTQIIELGKKKEAARVAYAALVSGGDNLSQSEYEYYQNILEEGLNARAWLIRTHMTFVVELAAVYQRRGMTLAEAVQNGYLGLIRAVDKYDPETGNMLTTYSESWIKQLLRRQYDGSHLPTNIPVLSTRLWRKIQNYRQDYVGEHGREPSIEHIRSVFNITADTAEALLRWTFTAPSLDDDLEATDGEYMSRAEQVGSPDASVEDTIIGTQLETEIVLFMNQLKPREKEIIFAAMGLDQGYIKRTNREVAQTLGVNRETVRQQIIAIKNRLAAHLKKLGYDQHLIDELMKNN